MPNWSAAKPRLPKSGEIAEPENFEAGATTAVDRYTSSASNTTMVLAMNATPVAIPMNFAERLTEFTTFWIN